MLREQAAIDSFTEFVKTAELRLQCALVPLLGLEPAREATAEALAYGWEHWDRLRNMENPAGYLYRVARTKGRRIRRLRPPLPQVASSEMPWVEPGLPKALAKLSSKQRTAVWLIHGLEWQQKEVADLLGISPATVQTHAEAAIGFRRHLMNHDIDTQLRDYANHVRSMISVIEVEEILDQPSEVVPDHRRMALRRARKRPRWGVAVAAAALVLVVVGGVSLIVSALSDDSVPIGDSDGLPLVEMDFGDIPPFRATYEVAPFPSHDEATNSELAVVQVSYGGSGVGYRLDGVEGRPDLPTDVGPGGVVIWDGEKIGVYYGLEPEEEFVRERTEPGYEPLGFFGWHTGDRSWQEFCRETNHQDLADEVVAGRTARHVRCVGVQDDLQLWVDAETGLVLRLAGSRGGFPRLSTGDFEVIAIEYDPVFASDTFLVVAPPGVPDAGLDDPGVGSEEPPDSSEPSSPDFGPNIRGSEGFLIPQGEVVPSFTGPLLGGGTFDLSELRGRPVVLMLWADWCPPCVDSLDAFQTLAGQWDDRVDFVSVLTLGGTPEFAAAVVQEYEFTIPVVIDLTDSLWNPLGIPNWVLIDSEGRALGGLVGGSDTQILNQLLEQFLQ